MPNTYIVKFQENSDLAGYGFDIAADRVVRFNKYPDGAYLNTRATYSINKKQFTHYGIRKEALSMKSDVPHTNKNHNLTLKFVVVSILLIFVFSSSNCSFEANSNVDYNLKEMK